MGLAGQCPTFRANRLGGPAGAGVARSSGTPLVVVAYMVVHGSGVASTVGTFVVLVARIVGFASVGGVVARDGRGSASSWRPSTNGTIGTLRDMDDCGKVYKFADEQEKRLLNQALFKRILVYDDLSLSAEFNAPFDTVISPSAQCLGANSKGNDPVSNQESLFTQVLRSQLAEKEAESVKQKEQHDMAALFGNALPTIW